MEDFRVAKMDKHKAPRRRTQSATPKTPKVTKVGRGCSTHVTNIVNVNIGLETPQHQVQFVTQARPEVPVANDVERERNADTNTF